MARHGKPSRSAGASRRRAVAALTALAVLSGGLAASAAADGLDEGPLAEAVAEVVVDPVDELVPDETPVDDPTLPLTDEPAAAPGVEPTDEPADEPTDEPVAEPVEPLGPPVPMGAAAAEPAAAEVSIVPASFGFNPPGTPLPGGTQPGGYVDGFQDAPWFGGGVNDGHWPWTPGSFTGNPNNADADLGTVHAATTMIDGDVWTHVAFDLLAYNGSVAFVVELNQNANRPGAFPVPDRAAGDVILFISNQSSTTRVELRRWSGTAWSSAAVADASLFDVRTDAASRVVSASVNVSGVFGDAPGLTNYCLGAFGMLNLRTMTSHAFTANLRDFVTGIPITTPQQCAADLTIQKTERLPDGSTRDGAGWEFTVVAGEPVTGDAVLTTGSDGRVQHELGLKHQTNPGSVTITETQTDPDWFFAGAVCSVNGVEVVRSETPTFTVPQVRDGDVVACSVENEQFHALTADATAAGTYVQPFAWHVDKQSDATPEEAQRARPGVGHEFEWTIHVQAERRDPTQLVATSNVTIGNPVGGRARSLDDLSILLGGRAPVSVTPAPAGLTLEPGHAVELVATWHLDEHPGDVAVTATLPGTASPITLAQLETWTARGESDRFVYLSDSFPEFGEDPDVNSDRLRLDALEHLAGRDHVYSATRGQDVAPGSCEHFPNTATLTADDGRDLADDTETVSVCVGEDLAVTKDASARLSRTFAWDLTKSVVGRSTLAADADGEATFDYVVTATPLGFSDTDWAMTGTVRVTNPNAWPVPLESVVDTPNLVGDFERQVCTPAEGPHVVPAATTGEDGSRVDGSLEISYGCRIVGRLDASAHHTNTVAVRWDPAVAASAGDEDTTTVPVEVRFAVANETITVVDDKTNPLEPVELGTADWHEGAQEFRYALTVDGPTAEDPGETVTHTNTAWIRDLPDVRDDAEVTVIAYDLALRVWVSEVWRDGVLVFERQADPSDSGPVDPLPHETYDDDDFDIEVGDLIVHDLHLFNQGAHPARVEELVNFKAPGLVFPVDHELALVDGHDNVGWEYGVDGNLELVMDEAGPVIMPGESTELHLTLEVTDEVLGDAEYAEKFTFVEISRFSGWVPETAVDPLTAPAPLGAPETPDGTAGFWSVGRDVDSTPDRENGATAEPGVGVTLVRYSWDDNVVTERNTTNLWSDDPAEFDNDEDDHDGSIVRVVAASRTTDREPTPGPSRSPGAPAWSGPIADTGGVAAGPSGHWWAVGGLLGAAALLLGFALRRRRDDA